VIRGIDAVWIIVV